MKWYLDRHEFAEHKHNDPATHRINYIESIMIRDGRIFYLTMGAHYTNAAYICLGIYKNDDILEHFKYLGLMVSGGDVEMELCRDYGIISIHSEDYAVYETISSEQMKSISKLYMDGHITQKLYDEMKGVYYG